MNKITTPFVVASEYLCYVALLEIILKNEGIKKYNQYDLAQIHGLCVPIDYVNTNDYVNIKYSENAYKWGVKVNKSILNNIFKFELLDVIAEYIDIKTISDWEFDGYLEYDEGYKYCVFLYDYGALNFGVMNSIGHAALLYKKIDSKSIYIYDPGPYNIGLKIINNYDIYKAIHAKNGGIMLIK